MAAEEREREVEKVRKEVVDLRRQLGELREVQETKRAASGAGVAAGAGAREHHLPRHLTKKSVMSWMKEQEEGQEELRGSLGELQVSKGADIVHKGGCGGGGVFGCCCGAYGSGSGADKCQDF